VDKKLTYISLFSSAGVGCYGFKINGFDCIITSELIERRLNVQKCNKKCKYESGYILGDITEENIKNKAFNEISQFKAKENIKEVDVVIATPPCQGMSVANHKKTDTEIKRNSLVVEAIEMVKRINPRFFIFENVQAFMKTNCYDHGVKKKIEQAINENLSQDYEYVHQILNFKNYGANSSRTRALVIGVRKDLVNIITPIELFPDLEEEKSLRQLIYNLPRLKEMGEIHEDDIYHQFKSYSASMRNWINDLCEGESAFDNKELARKPHKLVNGEIVVNVNKNGDKYKRQTWDKVAPCIHTRNDILASQNTVHPEDDRVFSIRELMILMNIPKEFKWVMEDEHELNKLPLEDKKKFLRKNEINIRQSIGEAVPTIILDNVASKIKRVLTENNPDDRTLKKLINNYHLEDIDKLHDYIDLNPENLSFNSLSRLAELSNSLQTETAAYYTDKNTLLTIFNNLPDIPKNKVHILEPSVGTGNFIPFIIKKYEKCEQLTIDVCDINENSIKILKLLLSKMKIPKNVRINFICNDFLKHNFNCRYDLIIGNPPFLKLKDSQLLKEYRNIVGDNVAKNTSALFLNKSLLMSDNIAMILPKYFLHNEDFKICREKSNNYAIKTIIDFGEKGFKGVLIETICLIISTVDKRGKTTCISITHNLKNILKQSILSDERFPNWMLYRNDFFDNVCKRMKFGIFRCFRDRQITKNMLKKSAKIWVIKSRNVQTDGSGIEHIAGYDSFIDEKNIDDLNVSKYLDRDDVYLCPNMTYYPRVVRKPKGTLVNGSVAILELNDDEKVTDEDLKYFSTDEFWKFYAIARNLSTRSLNIDNTSIYYFGKRV